MFVINAEKGKKYFTFSEAPLVVGHNKVFHINDSGSNQMINLKLAYENRYIYIEASLKDENRWVKIWYINNSIKEMRFILPNGYKLRTENGSSDILITGYVEEI